MRTEWKKNLKYLYKKRIFVVKAYSITIKDFHLGIYMK